MPTSKHRKPRYSNPAHLPTNATDNATKTLPPPPFSRPTPYSN